MPSNLIRHLRPAGSPDHARQLERGSLDACLWHSIDELPYIYACCRWITFSMTLNKHKRLSYVAYVWMFVYNQLYVYLLYVANKICRNKKQRRRQRCMIIRWRKWRDGSKRRPHTKESVRSINRWHKMRWTWRKYPPGVAACRKITLQRSSHIQSCSSSSRSFQAASVALVALPVSPVKWQFQ